MNLCKSDGTDARGKKLDAQKAKEWTADDVRELLGLQPFSAYGEMAVARNKSEGREDIYRGTGRSTVTYCKAIAEVLNDKCVLLVTENAHHRDFIKTIVHGYLAKIGLDERSVRVITVKDQEMFVGLEPDTEMVFDHYALEQ